MKGQMMPKTKWKKDEIPHVEVERVEFPDKPGDPIVFHLTPRGAAEKERRDKAFAKEQERIKRLKRSGAYGIPADWIIRGTGAGRYFY